MLAAQMTQVRFVKFAIGTLLAFSAIVTVGYAQEKSPPEPTQPPVAQTPPFPDFEIPPSASVDDLSAIIQKAKTAIATNPEQYQAKQTAIRDAAKKTLLLLKGKENSPEFRQAELETITASVSLMTSPKLGDAAKKSMVDQVHQFLKSRKELSMTDVQAGILAAAMIELQPNKEPARDTYELLDQLLKDDKREEMQSLRINLRAAIRRLDLLGNKLPLAAIAMDGKAIEIDDYAGKFVIVDFFATWCEPCVSEIPRLKKYEQQFGPRGLAVIGISLDSDEAALNAYLKAAELPWPVIHDNDENPLNRLQMEFGVSQLPTVLLLNKEGTVVSLEARGSELDRLMQMLFERPTLAAPLDANDKSEAASVPEQGRDTASKEN